MFRVNAYSLMLEGRLFERIRRERDYRTNSGQVIVLTFPSLRVLVSFALVSLQDADINIKVDFTAA